MYSTVCLAIWDTGRQQRDRHSAYTFSRGLAIDRKAWQGSMQDQAAEHAEAERGGCIVISKATLAMQDPERVPSRVPGHPCIPRRAAVAGAAKARPYKNLPQRLLTLYFCCRCARPSPAAR